MSSKQTRKYGQRVITDEKLKLYFLFFLYPPIHFLPIKSKKKVLKAQQSTALQAKVSVLENHYIIMRLDNKIQHKGKIAMKIIHKIIYTCIFTRLSTCSIWR